ncbi:glycoside hydrolase family 31 protein [Algoriphagus winogradskyi]|uniref:Alpha-glucosidase n=1 Tax=Algoriphagus winogradskyi TaxID=237017 RepID=A0ABY1PI50_9BACT|nr:glycoside hydrolase family 31 protein [Algoriphagus winogradskyi]SMP32513.1 alpha-glucosidase [Algoriphagus winogradskyi]
MSQNFQSSSATSSNSRYRPIGQIEKWQQNDNGITAESANARIKISLVKDGIIRVQSTQNKSFDSNPFTVLPDENSVEFSIEEKDDKIHLKSALIHFQIELNNGICSFFDSNGTLLNKDDSLGISWIGTEVTCYKEVQPNEKFIGLGEKTGNLNRFGNAYVNWNTDYFAYGISDDPLYMSIPFYIGTHEKGSYGIYFDNTHKSVFNFGASSDRFAYFNAEDGDMDYYFIHAPSVAEIISNYTSLTGRMKMPPKWALGFQQCRYSYYPDKEVYAVANTFRDKNMPADVIYLDIHHMEKYKVFTFDGEKFPDPKSMIAKLKERGFRVVVIMDPGIKTEKGYLPFDEGKSKGLFVKYPDNKDYIAQVWPGSCAFPDFTKEETRKWWGEKMEFYTDAGVDGFWADMNEPASWGQFTPNLIEFDLDGNPASHRKARNVYGMQMARAVQEGALLQNPNKRPFVLTRSGFAGVQRFAAAWTGDNQSSEEHMLAGVRLINSLGLSGVSFSGFDIGGFAGEASKSLFARWMSIGAFTPLYRAHSMINTKDAEPWSFGEEVEEISRNYMKLRYNLIPTIYSKMYESTRNGLPISSSLAISNVQDPKIYESAFQNQYLFCDTFLVAPVESTKAITKVYLPEAEWYYLFSDDLHKGNTTIYQDCPLAYLPVYVKGGSIFTCQSDLQYTGESHNGILYVHVYAGKENGTFLHYEDDGESWDFEDGRYHSRSFAYNSSLGSLAMGETSGEFQTAYTMMKIYFHGFHNEEVEINGCSEKLNFEDFSFVGKLSEFDPLPDHENRFFEIKNLAHLTIPYPENELIIKGLKIKK